MPPAKSTKKATLSTIIQSVESFVHRQKGKWEHEDWERLLDTVKTAGVEISDVTKRHIGNMLEAGKHFYTSAPAPGPAPGPKKRATKRKTKAKSKTKTKTKAKSKAKTTPKAKARTKRKSKAKAKS